jgi:hypothetical protein
MAWAKIGGGGCLLVVGCWNVGRQRINVFNDKSTIYICPKRLLRARTDGFLVGEKRK